METREHAEASPGSSIGPGIEGAVTPFVGASEMAARCRGFDWAATSLGSVEGWPPVLRALVGVVLQARQPMILWWGPELVQVYNDATRPMVGERDRVALGAKAREFWEDAWPAVGPEIEAMLAGGPATWHEDGLVPLVDGDGRLVDRYWTYGYTPVREGGEVVGVLTTFTETTSQVRARGAREDALLHSNELLQDQAAELEAQTEELQTTAEQLEERTAAAEAALEALAASEARYQVLQTSLDDAYCVIEIVVDAGGRPVDYRFLETNPAFGQQTGLEDAVGRSARALIPGLEQHWIEAYGRVARTGVPVRMENEAATLGRWFDVFAFRVDEPEARHVAVLVKDISDRRRAAAERERLSAHLETERARLEAIVRIAPAFMAVLQGPEHVITLTNTGYDALVGGRDVRGRTVAQALPEAAEQGFIALLDRVLRTGEPFIGREAPYRRPGAPGEEEVRYLDFVYQALSESDGTRSGVFVHGVDVTDQVHARTEVERLLQESEAARGEAEAARREAERSGAAAREANQAKSQFLATMSHELRTPINALLGYAQLLEIGVSGPLNDAQRTYLQRMAGSGHHLLGLVNEVLDLAQIDAGGLRVARVEALTGPAIQEAIDLVRPQAAAKRVEIVNARQTRHGEPFVGDEDRVRQIVLNLLSNGVKFSAAGSVITVGCTREAETPPAAGHLSGTGPWTALRVIDTGVGIAPEQQGRIFEAFHQIDGSPARAQGGTGLGLAISRRLARLMGGDLTVESSLGEGSTFTLWLPAVRQDARSPETATSRTARAEPDLGSAEAPGLAAVGDVVRANIEDVLAAYTDRLRAEVAHGQQMRRAELEDHAVSFLADLAQSLVILGEAGPEAADLLRDGSAIQRTVAEHHGARRHAQGWDLEALHRDHEVLREEVERIVRARLPQSNDGVDAAIAVFLGLINRAEAVGVRAWHRAAEQSNDRPVER